MLKSIIQNSQRFALFAVLAIVLIGALAYANCLGNEMFWDDDDFILKNRFIKDFSFWPLWFKENLVAGSYLVSNYWRPLLLSIFTLEWSLWKDWVYGWHIVSIAWHILDGVLLYFLINRLFTNRIMALVAALIFTVHPVHNEAVVYVNSLGDSLATFFVLSSLLLFVRFRQSNKPAYLSRNYFFSMLCFPLALLSKETGIVLAGLLPLTDFLLLQINKPFWQRVRSTASIFWPFVLMAVYYLYLRGTVLNFSNSFNFYNESNAFTSSFWVRLMTFFKAMTQYAGFLFIPYESKVERQMPWAQSPLEWDVLFGGIIVAVMLFFAFKSWRQKPWISFSVGWFFIAIAPTSNVLVPINAVLYEHFLYMPMIGITVLLAYWLTPKIYDGKNQDLVLKIFILALIVFIGLNIRRNMDWHTAIRFYEKLVSYAPSYRVINNLGMEYADKGIHDKAEIWYAKAIEMDASNPVAYHNIAGTQRDTGRIDKALVNFNKAIQLNPDFIFSYRSLAELYWRLERWPECREALLQILRIDPSDINVRQALEMVNRIK